MDNFNLTPFHISVTKTIVNNIFRKMRFLPLIFAMHYQKLSKIMPDIHFADTIVFQESFLFLLYYFCTVLFDIKKSFDFMMPRDQIDFFH